MSGFSSTHIGIRRRPTLPGRVQPSTIGAEGLNFCVRYGNRWDPFAIATGNCCVLWRLRSAVSPLILLAQGNVLSSRSLPLLWGPFRSLPCLPAAHRLLATSLCQVRCVLRIRSFASYARFRTLTTAQVKDVLFFASVACASFAISQTFVSVSLKSSPRPISIIKLHTLPYFHR